MSTYDPRIVAQALDDLQSQLTRWSSIASEMLATATNTQRHAKEAIDRALHNATIVLDRAKDDEENVQKAISSVATAIENCTTAKTTAHQTLQEAQSTLEEADATLKKWEASLEKALAWLARAEARLAKAIQELQQAQSALRSAEWDLSNAESRYRSCMNDKERSNCNNEAAAVNRAKAEVAGARQWVSAAQQEVNAAREEVARAKARVACCEKAVSFSTKAVSLAQESISSASQAVNSAERSLEFAYAAERLIHIAEKKMVAEVEAAETMMLETRAAQELTDNAAVHLRTADGSEDVAQTYSKSVRKELEYRVQLLHELNRPSLVNSEKAVSYPVENKRGSRLKIIEKFSIPHEHRGINWQIDVEVKDNGRVDLYIKGPKDNYPHIHAFYPDAHSGTNQIAVLSWAKKGEHTALHEMPTALMMYILDLIANLPDPT